MIGCYQHLTISTIYRVRVGDFIRYRDDGLGRVDFTHETCSYVLAACESLEVLGNDINAQFYVPEE
jgi:hypothetical protein